MNGITQGVRSILWRKQLLIPKTPSEEVLFSTIRIQFRDKNTNRIGYASSFIVNFFTEDKDGARPVLITNKHAISNAEDIKLKFHDGDGKNPPSPTGNYIQINCSDDVREVLIDHPDENIDLCAIPLAKLFHDLRENEITPYFKMFPIEMIQDNNSLLEELPAANTVQMYGYPIGLCDDKNNFPLIRQGITSSHPGVDFNGRPEGVLDIACFPGSSGSPILIIRESPWYSKKKNLLQLGGGKNILLGTLWGGATMKPDGMIDVKSIPVQNEVLDRKKMLAMHIGYYIKASEIHTLREEYDKHFEKLRQKLKK